jgi:hypothetical protein
LGTYDIDEMGDLINILYGPAGVQTRKCWANSFILHTIKIKKMFRK